ncbi:hypothetical protein GOP47_0025792 [Adiantum capillus-veneris]|uniref:Aminotransferase class I/classII large domain-containing protein n=1 Tax=Adiantum capillus-veneris TaxID=13818 RepID=A0A9D4U157_ADICA|nr:hypothetical protein GOP47_0025792 [Adiantum capillus-veneris]
MAKGFPSGVERSELLSNCESELFFSKLRAKVLAHNNVHPNEKLISLSIGDASEPIPQIITSVMEQFAHGLSTREGFSGYTTHHGPESLRTQIVEVLYKGLGVKPSDVFVSDGAKGCLARLMMMFGSAVTMAVPDPTYPVIPQMCNLFGQNVIRLSSKPDGGFFPDLSNAPRTDLIYVCSPNNPTGIAATREQLADLVSFARKNGSIILYDAVYAAFIADGSPKSIYEIPGATEVAIEIGSFSKLAGFTGVRLGWVVVPDSVVFANGKPVVSDYSRVTLLVAPAGASNIAQAGGSACLTQEGIEELMKIIEYYKENARILLNAFASFGLEAHGGLNSPYIWVQIPGRSSDEVCDEWLERAHVLITPGDMFGPSGEGFLRVSAFGHREIILEAVTRLKAIYPPM